MFPSLLRWYKETVICQMKLVNVTLKLNNKSRDNHVFLLPRPPPYNVIFLAFLIVSRFRCHLGDKFVTFSRRERRCWHALLFPVVIKDENKEISIFLIEPHYNKPRCAHYSEKNVWTTKMTNMNNRKFTSSFLISKW